MKTIKQVIIAAMKDLGYTSKDVSCIGSTIHKVKEKRVHHLATIAKVTDKSYEFVDAQTRAVGKAICKELANAGHKYTDFSVWAGKFTEGRFGYSVIINQTIPILAGDTDEMQTLREALEHYKRWAVSESFQGEDVTEIMAAIEKAEHAIEW